MTLEEFKERLETTGLPVAYRHFQDDEHVQMPFVVYCESNTNNMAADDTVFKEYRHIQVDLFSTEKDEVSEDKIKSVLGSIGFYNSTETYEEGQLFCRMTYEIEI
jgi:hypothetical protein